VFNTEFVLAQNLHCWIPKDLTLGPLLFAALPTHHAYTDGTCQLQLYQVTSW